MDESWVISRRSEILESFEGFRDELDEHNDRRERIIKTNRDITNLSKKLIFQLHRTAQEEIATEEGRAKVIDKSWGKFLEIQTLHSTLEADLAGEWGWKYARNVSGGLQELIEALSLRRYLLHGNMITLTEIQQFLAPEARAQKISSADYLLGISDLTGELMRHAISTITKPGGRDRALGTSQFVRRCVSDFETFVPHIRELAKKQDETNASLRKIEDALYAVRIREYEYGQVALDGVVGRFAYQV